jgi:hypothetical protein
MQNSSKMSPKARKSLLTPEENVAALVEVRSAAGAAGIEKQFRDAGATRVSWVNKPKLASIEIPSHGLARIASLDDVIYIEVAQPMTF